MMRRLTLMLIPGPFLVFIPSPSLAFCHSLYFMLPACGLATYAVLLNFPQTVAMAHAKPIYYEDLEDENADYQKYFVLITQVSVTLIATSIGYYYYDRFHDSRLSCIEMLGVLGGFISFATKVERAIGKVLLAFLHRMRVSGTPPTRLFDLQEIAMVPLNLDSRQHANFHKRTVPGIAVS